MAKLFNGGAVGIWMSYSVGDYLPAADSVISFESTSDYKITYTYQTTYGQTALVVYEGYGLLGSDPFITDYYIGGVPGPMLISWDEIGVSMDGLNDLILGPMANASVLSGADQLGGTDYNDELIGFRGADWFNAKGGDDIIRAGNGPDDINGGPGADTLYGGFGKNAFFDNLDGSVDKIYIKSDQFAYNYLYGKAGNSPNGEKIDFIYNADPFDQIYIQGASTSEITVAPYFGDLGIFVNGYVEASYLGGNLSQSQLQAMVFGA